MDLERSGKKRALWIYVGLISVDTEMELDKVLVIGEVSSLEFVP